MYLYFTCWSRWLPKYVYFSQLFFSGLCPFGQFFSSMLLEPSDYFFFLVSFFLQKLNNFLHIYTFYDFPVRKSCSQSGPENICHEKLIRLSLYTPSSTVLTILLFLCLNGWLAHLKTAGPAS